MGSKNPIQGVQDSQDPVRGGSLDLLSPKATRKRRVPPERFHEWLLPLQGSSCSFPSILPILPSDTSTNPQ